jgi:hypothetical protein
VLPILNHFSLRQSDKADIPQLYVEVLTAYFTEQEVYDAIMQME